MKGYRALNNRLSHQQGVPVSSSAKSCALMPIETNIIKYHASKRSILTTSGWQLFALRSDQFCNSISKHESGRRQRNCESYCITRLKGAIVCVCEGEKQRGRSDTAGEMCVEESQRWATWYHGKQLHATWYFWVMDGWCVHAFTAEADKEFSIVFWTWYHGTIVVFRHHHNTLILFEVLNTMNMVID